MSQIQTPEPELPERTRPAPLLALSRRQMLAGISALLVLAASPAAEARRRPSKRYEYLLDRTVRLQTTDGVIQSGQLVAVDAKGVVIALASGEEVRHAFDQILWLELFGTAEESARLYNQTATAIGEAAGALGITLIFLVFALVIVVKGSCPFVYVVDAKTGRRKLWGEAYSGAVVKALARSDALRLPDAAPGPLTLVLANEAPETQYTDAAWLELVALEPGQRVLATHDAQLVTVGEPVEPESVVDLDGVDRSGRVAPGSERAWGTDLVEASERRPRPSFEGLHARYASAPAAAVLELDLRNSPWLDRVSMLAWAALGERRLEQVQADGREGDSAGRAVELMEKSGIHARVEVRQGGTEWREVARIPPVGWVGRRNIAVPLGAVEAGAPLEVRLTGGIGFLIVHRMVLAPGLGAVETTRVDASRAEAASGADELERMASVDDTPNVLEQLHDEVTLGFELPEPPEGRTWAAFLRTHGYYEVHPPDSVVSIPMARKAMRRPEQFGAVGLALFERHYAAFDVA